MSKYCTKCRTENIIVKDISKWDKSETIEPTEISINFECLECGNNYSLFHLHYILYNTMKFQNYQHYGHQNQ